MIGPAKKVKKKPGPPKGTRYGGRQKGTPNKTTAEMKELAAAYGPKALKFLGQVMEDDKNPIEVRVKASDHLLNRGYGKPAQTTNLAGHDGGPLDLGSLGDADLDTLAEKLLQTLGAATSKK